MTFNLAAVLSIVAVLTATIAALLVQRRALRRSEAFFRHMADDSPIIMWTTRPDTTFDYLNKFCVEFSGMTLNELLGEGWLNAVHVRDNGLGIPESDQPAIFERFFRAHAHLNGQLGVSGTGLGGAIAVECADALGGAIRCESAVNKGTTFFISLPRRPLGGETSA